MSMPPSRATISENAASIAASSDTSASAASPLAGVRHLLDQPLGSFAIAVNDRHPGAGLQTAPAPVARPMPLAPPVTIATGAVQPEVRAAHLSFREATA
jgi:hypothetical protein